MYGTYSKVILYTVKRSITHSKEARKNVFFEKWLTQKPEFFKIANSQTIFVKISWIGPWVIKID